ncbi:hypothetical protein FGRMN_10460 [Fusarium graminum]|nr:hypothetical protein FGRMN_10460 [Fusarium graminum]
MVVETLLLSSKVDWAARNGNEEVVKILLADRRVDFNPKLPRTPLAFAIDRGCAKIVEVLLDAGRADLNMEDENGETVLMTAAKAGNTTIVKVLLDADSNQLKASVVLFYAAVKGHTEIVPLLLVIDNINVNSRHELGCTPLHFAASRGHTEVAKLLLENGADSQVVDDEGYTPISLATEYKTEKMIRLLP